MIEVTAPAPADNILQGREAAVGRFQCRTFLSEVEQFPSHTVMGGQCALSTTH